MVFCYWIVGMLATAAMKCVVHMKAEKKEIFICSPFSVVEDGQSLFN